MADPVRWGIAGTGGIAGVLARAIEASSEGLLVAVGSRDRDRAAAFAASVGAPMSGTYEDVIAADEVDVVYVAAVHPLHRSLAVGAAEAGKHILCEKPIAVNERDAIAIVDAARANGVTLIEAFAYRSHPQTARLLDEIRSGRIGQVRAIEATFGYDAGGTAKSYLFSNELAGGAILDVGCYPTSMSHLVAANALGGTAVEAIDVSGSADMAPTGVDLSANATITFPEGIVATVGCAIDANLENAVVIEGTLGRIRISSPWLPGRIGPAPAIHVEPHAGSAASIPAGATVDIYTIEVDAVHDAVRAGMPSVATMPWEDSLANIRTLDRWREAIGLRFADDDGPGG